MTSFPALARIKKKTNARKCWPVKQSATLTVVDLIFTKTSKSLVRIAEMTKVFETLNACLDTTKCCFSVDRLKQFCLCRGLQGVNEVTKLLFVVVLIRPVFTNCLVSSKCPLYKLTFLYCAFGGSCDQFNNLSFCIRVYICFYLYHCVELWNDKWRCRRYIVSHKYFGNKNPVLSWIQFIVIE